MTLEQCEKLKEWGLPQGDCPQTYFEDKRGVTILADPVTVSDYFTGGEKEICACPDLEQLLEFADRKLKGITLWREKEWMANENSLESMWLGQDPDPKVAVYKLLEKVTGV